MSKSESEKELFVQKLSEMFTLYEKHELRQFCEGYDWKEQTCVEALIKIMNSLNITYNDWSTTNKTKRQPPLSEEHKGSLVMPENRASTSKTFSNLESKELELIPTYQSFATSGPGPSRIGAKNNMSNQRKFQNPQISFDFLFYNASDIINKGYKCMVIMRGAPGSGKSYLARQLVQHCDLLKDGYTANDFIFSSDDYFYNYYGRYDFNPQKLDEAHNFNHERVRKKAQQGWSPIVVDNTNMQLWEMKIYAQIAVENGYLVHILEPNTPWKFSPRQLAARNLHNVPKTSIQKMIDKYEPGSVDDLLKMLKHTKYSVPCPQLRNYPVIQFRPSGPPDTNPQDLKNEIVETEALNPLFKNPPQTQRIRAKKPNSLVSDETSNNYWKPYEKESADFWNLPEAKPETSKQSATILVDPPKKNDNSKNLLEILKEDFSSSITKMETNDSENPMKTSEAFTPHCAGCPNENPQFVLLREVYQNTEISSLWDLFVKCDGNVNWAADILLKEGELVSENEDPSNVNRKFENICFCGQEESRPNIIPPALPIEIDDYNEPSTSAKSQRARSGRTPKHSLYKKPESDDIKQQIENKFVFSEENYPEGVRKFREKLHSNLLAASTEPVAPFENEVQIEEAPFKGGNEKDFTEEEPEDDNDEILEISLGVELVSQLQDLFREEYYLAKKVNDHLNTNVFIPRSMAKQLFMLWMESVHNQIEEENQKMIKDDECFARLLKNPKYENCMESPHNVPELLDNARLEFEKYEKNFAREAQEASDFKAREDINRQDLATKLTERMLCEQYPYIPENILLDIFTAHKNDYGKTLATLQTTFDLNTSNDKDKKFNILEVDTKEKEEDSQIIGSSKQDKKDKIDAEGKSVQRKAPTGEEAKHIALREFEDTRNLAAHHCQLKAECYEKAREAIQRNQGGVAAYYSHMASFHKSKIDKYNNRAANCIMEVHKYTQNNPDLLDLHYLHVIEAIGCLDIFLDQHIASMRQCQRSFKQLFIITGRGLHSIGGISSIKNKVKLRLRERGLRWTEVNPGLLKVKLFPSARYTTDI